MNDPFANNATGLSSPANRHFSITPADEDLETKPRCLYVNESGTLIIRDEMGVDVTYNVIAGQIFPFRGVQIRAASTATVIGWV